jgi:hypothetical protein
VDSVKEYAKEKWIKAKKAWVLKQEKEKPEEKTTINGKWKPPSTPQAGNKQSAHYYLQQLSLSLREPPPT